MIQTNRCLWLLSLAALVLLCTQCKKTNSSTPQTELEKLPPITQTGANTFGCLVNGVAWLPNGRKPQTGGPNIVGYVDPTFQGGRFSISGHQYNNLQSRISFGATTCSSSGIFDISLPICGLDYNRFESNINTCEFSSSDTGTYRMGYFNITRYDLVNGVFSGTFDFKIKSNNCGDTIKITNGRFDIKL